MKQLRINQATAALSGALIIILFTWFGLKGQRYFPQASLTATTAPSLTDPDMTATVLPQIDPAIDAEILPPGTAPVITSFSPLSAHVGSTVTIAGSGFDAVPESNVVYFGAVRAVVQSASTSSLVVTVPAGASYAPIRVTSFQLNAWSAQPFVVTFAGGGSIHAASFTEKIALNLAPAIPLHITQGDIDGDGKTDLVVTKAVLGSAADSGFLVFRNTSTTTTVSFANPVAYSMRQCRATAMEDVDGDGVPDVVAVGGDSIYLYKNNSTAGNISISLQHRKVSYAALLDVALRDMDGDGKTDVIVHKIGAEEFDYSFVFAYPNTSTAGTISFSNFTNSSSLSGQSRFLQVAELNNDGKPDMLANAIIRNKSTKGNISLYDPVGLSLPWHAAAATGDIDQDGLIDLVYIDSIAHKVSVARNVSSGGTISFAAPVELIATASPDGVAINDLDGDGKAEIILALSNYNYGVFKNISTAGSPAFLPMQAFKAGNYRGRRLVVASDINGDGKADVVTGSAEGRSVNVFINEVKAAPVIYGFTPTIGEAGTEVTISGANFDGSTGVSFGGVAAASYQVVSSSTIKATIGTGATGAVVVTNAQGAGELGGFVFGLPPRISSIAPLQGPIGATVTITGDHFSPVAASNIVYFGGVKAKVNSATANAIQVTVPVGAGYRPLSVTTNGRTASSTQVFTVTFPGATDTFSRASLAGPWEKNVASTYEMTDMDGDGLPDMVGTLSFYAGQGVSILRNMSVPGNFAFGNAHIFPTAALNRVITADLDGDGLQDAITTGSSNISVLRNTSTPGNFVLSAPTYYKTGHFATRPWNVRVEDVDGDGKPDVIVANDISRTVAILKNISTENAIALAEPVEFVTPAYPDDVEFGDLDGDGKPEMVVASPSYRYEIYVFLNTGKPGTIAFAPYKAIPIGSAGIDVSVADMDNDQKNDILVEGSLAMSVLANQSTAGNLSFTRLNFPAENYGNAKGIGDLDGDGRPEVVTANAWLGSNKWFTVLKNNSTPGNPSLLKPTVFTPSDEYGQPIVVDADGDSLPDLILPWGSATIIYRNIIGKSALVRYCVNGNTSIKAGITGSGYQWQQKTGSGYVNIADNSNFEGANKEQLQVKSIPADWDSKQLRCIIDGKHEGVVYKLVASPAVTPAVTIAATATTICTGVPVTFTSTIANGGNQPTFEWAKNGSTFGNNWHTVTVDKLVDGDAITAKLYSNALCATSSQVTSNTIKIRVNAAAASVSIAGNTVVEQGKSADLTATIVNGGSSPAVQWQDSTDTRGWVNIAGATNNVITYKPAVTGVRLRAQLISNSNCVSTNPWLSNVLQFTVTAVTAIGPEPAANWGIRYYPNPVTTELIIDSLRRQDQWESVAVTGVNGKQVILTKAVNGQSRVVVPTASLAKGYYVAILRRKRGAPVYFRFMKL
ncbi:FG-GAP-like repeat-containing protein [Paraflavitalea sp. CAU 1676]|uniref:FG-GAP-like repeat-containing protein n=1 Tax=Paraflavitalea sp. CAU 1676 TaxID=3032598 RepID=UPI0023DC5704|nr:FG-GAP-like repeat-containing protein [Paraflavitalea sp. CAU 1676]MDF2188204.1 FG-GAP-like repeat-containing protein [Paraflavitalea sp. CAU 1676]